MEKIILASASPRRKEILGRMGLQFKVLPQDVDETFSGATPVNEAVAIALKKTESCLNADTTNKSAWVLGADTFVVLDNEYIGKAGNREEAFSILKKLSGRTHQVVTGLALNIPGKGITTDSCTTDVTFSAMSQSEIEWYLDQNEWQGVAASYRIQQKGALFISSIKGSYSNVMGLPINTFYGMLVSDNFNFRT